MGLLVVTVALNQVNYMHKPWKNNDITCAAIRYLGNNMKIFIIDIFNNARVTSVKGKKSLLGIVFKIRI